MISATNIQQPPFVFRYRQCAPHSRIPQIVEVARTIKRHWAGIVNWAENRITNGILEGFNSLFQADKANSRYKFMGQNKVIRSS